MTKKIFRRFLTRWYEIADMFNVDFVMLLWGSCLRQMKVATKFGMFLDFFFFNVFMGVFFQSSIQVYLTPKCKYLLSLMFFQTLTLVLSRNSAGLGLYTVQ